MTCHLAAWTETGEEGAPLDDGEHRLFLQEKPGIAPAVKAARLRAYLERHDIEWVSLQFVNFGFSKKGFIPGLAAALADALTGRRVHIFLHELWLGAHRGAKLRDRFFGALQKRRLLHLLAVLQPEQVWTSIAYYRTLLEREGVTAREVPIFGNVPFTCERADEMIWQRLTPELARKKREQYFFVGLFGAIDRSWPFREVAPRLLQFAGARQTVFVLFGRNGPSHLFREYIDSIPEAEYLSLGALDPEVIDQVMNSMDVALATTPAEGTFKSTSAVSFLERGVPTVAVHHGLETPPTSASPVHPSLILLDEWLEQNLAAATGTDRNSRRLLPMVAQSYLELFTASAPSRPARAREKVGSARSKT
ncbi:MAG TPA: hypothetical protein VK474_04965 [Chthoniobacterales bacterium]|nr:hypothetical protein [Chthoniobacterales bacterium]